MALAKEHSESFPSSQDLGRATAEILKAYFAAHRDGLPPAGLYARVVREVERPLIIQSLIATQGNQIQAAKLLGINRNTLRNKMRDLGLSSESGAWRRSEIKQALQKKSGTSCP